jgi:hypothetical protein
MKVIDQQTGTSWAAYNGDCVEVAQGIPSESVGFSIFSPPFSSLYTYSNSERDMGNCRRRWNVHGALSSSSIQRIVSHHETGAQLLVSLHESAAV